MSDRLEDKRDLIAACFALGATFDAMKDYGKAFLYYDKGNRLQDAEYEAQGVDPHIDVAGMTGVFTPELFRAFADRGSPSDKPIFIVSMPRSGTTLVEQILASHPDMVGGGELTEIPGIAEDLAEGAEARGYPECVADLDRQAIGELASGYLSCLDEISRDARHVTDKMPENYLHLGLIAILFPKARIVHCRRDPMATCASIFFRRFDAFHPSAFDLGKLGTRYRAYRQLMEHWRRVLPLPTH